MPGIAPDPEKDYSHHFPTISDEKKAKVMEILKFTHKYCSRTGDKSGVTIPTEWQTAYDMRPWAAFPERG